MARKTVLITGASRGIGKLTAEYFAQQGWLVYAAVRDMRGVRFDHPEIQLIQMDVDSIGSVARSFHLLKGNIDVLVNNAGFGTYGPFESLTDSEMEAQLRTNVLGVLRVTKTAVAQMAKGGVIINISSVAGRIGIPYYSVYSASKFAVEGLSEALYYELAVRGLHVKVVEPGPVKTDFFKPEKNTLAEYAKMSKVVDEYYEKSFGNGDEPLVIAKLIYTAATDGKDQLYYMPPKARSVVRAKKLLPSNWFVRRYKRQIHR